MNGGKHFGKVPLSTEHQAGKPNCLCSTVAYLDYSYNCLCLIRLGIKTEEITEITIFLLLRRATKTAKHLQQRLVDHE